MSFWEISRAFGRVELAKREGEKKEGISFVWLREEIKERER